MIPQRIITRTNYNKYYIIDINAHHKIIFTVIFIYYFGLQLLETASSDHKLEKFEVSK